MKIKIIGLLTLSLFITANAVYADNNLSADKLNEIETRVQSMNYSQLIDAQNQLNEERGLLLSDQANTQSPAQNKSINKRLLEITAELSAIQKAVLAIVSVSALNSITDDGYNDDVPPVITINGDNPISVELGSAYSDPGATAMDAFHGSTVVTSSSNVDTSAVVLQCYIYSNRQDGNTATATRTVNVVDTTAPVITVTGTNPATVELGGTYTDSGATATDLDTVTVTAGTADTSTVGVYTITYLLQMLQEILLCNKNS